MQKVEVVHQAVEFTKRGTIAAPGQIAKFELQFKSTLWFKTEFSEAAGVAVFAAQLYDKNDVAFRTIQFTIPSSGFSIDESESGWYHGEGYFLETAGMSGMLVDLISISAGSVDVWTGEN